MTGSDENNRKKKTSDGLGEKLKSLIPSKSGGSAAVQPERTGASAITAQAGPAGAADGGAGAKPLNSFAKSLGSAASSALPAAAGIAGAGLGTAAAGAGAGLGVLAGTVGALVSAGNYIEARKKLEKTLNEQPEYRRSAELENALEGLKELENSKPGEYRSAYENEINSLLTEIEERPDFSYDFNADPLYMQYRDQYIRNGRLAMDNTVAEASALTGGYGNSYAVTAGSQAFQSYLNELNGVIPELEERAFDRWKEQGREKAERLEMLHSLDVTEYGRWQDSMDSYYRDLEYAFDKAQTLEERDWEMYLNELEQWGFKTEFYDDMARNAFGDAADSIGTVTKSFADFGDSLAETAWNAADLLEEQRQFNSDMAYKRDKAAVEHSEWQSEFDRTLERDARDDYEWNTEFDYKQQRDARSDYEWDEEFGYKKARDSVKDEQWQAELNEKIREFNLKNSGSASSSSSSSSSKSKSGQPSAAKAKSSPAGEGSQSTLGSYTAVFGGAMSAGELAEFKTELKAEKRDDVQKRMLDAAYESGRLSYSDYCLLKEQCGF